MSPLRITIPPDWVMVYQGDKSPQGEKILYSYVLTKQLRGSPVMLILSRSLAPTDPAQIPAQLDSLAKGFLELATTTDRINLAAGYTKGDLRGQFSGGYVTFTVMEGLVQAMFAISNGVGIWDGQFTGSSKQWFEAMEILKNIESNE